MRVLTDFAYADRTADVLMLLIPGAMQQPEEFLHAGFADAVRARKLSLDLAMIDCDMRFIGDSIDGSILTRLHDEVMQAAQQKPYREIWLGGISIGGLIATAYIARYPDAIHGLCLLAPYPGNRILLADIVAAGGLDCWQADGDDSDAEQCMWRWLQCHRQHWQQVQIGTLYFGYGCDDRFAQGQQLMAQAFDARQVDVIDGEHDWATWRTLWNNFIEHSVPYFERIASEARA